VPVAVYCCALPAASVVLVGESAIEVNVAFLTVPVTASVTAPLVAVTAKLPAPTAVNNPLELILATLAGITFQVTTLVTDAVLPSEYLATAVNCCVPAKASVPLAGAMAIDVTAGALTIPDAVAVTDPLAAVTVKLPAATAVTRPSELIVATLAGVALQVAEWVRSPVEPSE
jgi:hypothetical protein